MALEPDYTPIEKAFNEWWLEHDDFRRAESFCAFIAGFEAAWRMKGDETECEVPPQKPLTADEGYILDCDGNTIHPGDRLECVKPRECENLFMSHIYHCREYRNGEIGLEEMVYSQHGSNFRIINRSAE